MNQNYFNNHHQQDRYGEPNRSNLSGMHGNQGARGQSPMSPVYGIMREEQQMKRAEEQVFVV